MTHQPTELVRKGTLVQDARRELAIRIDPPAPNKWLPAVMTRESFVIPTGEFAKPIDMDGNPIRTRVPLTDEPIEIHPELTLHGVAGEAGGRRLAAALYHHTENQITAIADLIDGIFRRTIGRHPDMDQLQQLCDPHTREYRELAEKIEDELGLNVEWTLQPEPRAAKLLNQLRIHTPVQETLSFNEELPAEEFKLTFTLTVVGADLRQIHQIIRRAEGNRSVRDEIATIFKRVKEITVPAFRSALMGVTQWNQDIIRELAVDGIANTVARKIQQDYGYVVKFTDFSPELNRVLADALKELSRQSREHLLTDVNRTRQLVSKFKDQRHNALEEFEGDFEMVSNLDESIRRAEEEHEKAKKVHLNGIANNLEVKMLDTSEPVSIKQLQSRFNQAITNVESSEDERKYGTPRDPA